MALLFLGVSSLLNIGLDLLFVLQFHWGVAGAAAATVIAQWFSGIGIAIYTAVRFPEFRVQKEYRRWDSSVAAELFHLCGGLHLCTSADADLRKTGGSTGRYGRCGLSACRGSILLPDRIFIPLLRLFPCDGTSGSIGRFNRHLAWNQSRTCISSVCHPADRCDRDLGGSADRLVFSRRDRACPVKKREENIS